MCNNFVKIFSIIFLLSLVCGCTERSDSSSVLDYVDPHIGGVGHLLQPTRPNVQLPNQVIRMHPVRSDYLDDQISFFLLQYHRTGSFLSSECFPVQVIRRN